MSKSLLRSSCIFVLVVGRLSPVLPFFISTPATPSPDRPAPTPEPVFAHSDPAKVKQLTKLVSAAAAMASCSLAPDIGTAATLVQTCWDVGCLMKVGVNKSRSGELVEQGIISLRLASFVARHEVCREAVARV